MTQAQTPLRSSRSAITKRLAWKQTTDNPGVQGIWGRSRIMNVRKLMYWSLAADPRDQPSRHCSPNAERMSSWWRRTCIPLPYRRVAAADEPAAVRRTRREGGDRSRRDAEIGVDSSRPGTTSHDAGLRAVMGQKPVLFVHRCGDPNSTTSCCGTPRPRVRASSRAAASAQVDFPPERRRGRDGTGRRRTGAEVRSKIRPVDASGRDTLLAGRLAIKQRNRRHASAAVFGHFTGARRLPGKAAGNISIFWFEHGWFWFIPLSTARPASAPSVPRSS